jgi:hypothetical protein
MIYSGKQHLCNSYNRTLIPAPFPNRKIKPLRDIKGLKLINDAYGQNKGDEVLKKIAEIF